MTRTITASDGSVEVEPLAGGRSRVKLVAREVETGFPIELLSEIVAANGAWWGLEEIARHEAPEYVLGAIRRQVDAYFERGDFAGKRLLDFGCGSGASTFGLAEMLPDTEVVGVELDESKLVTARLIAQHKRLANVRFLQSPNGSELPAGIGAFDAVMLSAVWEHLLPAERPVISDLLWRALKPGGVLLINQTPYRWAPFEHHTTGLWGINYLPDRLACHVARNYARETPADLARCDWPQLLRRGIRGGTEGEVLKCIRAAGGNPSVLDPRLPFLDRADYWLKATGPRRRTFKRALSILFRISDRLLGTMPVVHLDMAIRKRS